MTEKSQPLGLLRRVLAKFLAGKTREIRQDQVIRAVTLYLHEERRIGQPAAAAISLELWRRGLLVRTLPPL